MKARVVALVATLLPLGSVAAPARADDEAVRKEIQALYDRAAKAFGDKDSHAYIEVTAPGYTEKHFDGKTLNREQTEAMLKEFMAGMVKSFGTSSWTPGNITIRGDQATAVSTQVLSEVLLDPQGKEHSGTYRGIWRDTWKKTGDGWKLQRLVATKEELILDGKKAGPYDPFGQQEGATGAQSGDEAVRKELQAIYDSQARGWKEKDLRAIVGPVAADYSGKLLNGQTENRQQSEASNRALLGITKSVDQIAFKIADLTVRGDDATAIVVGRASAVDLDPQGKEHPVTYSGVTSETWRRSGGGWKLRRWEELKTEWTVDGKPSDLSELLGPQPSVAQTGDESVRKELQALYDRGDKAWREKDMRTILAFPLMADYTARQLNGKTINRQEDEAGTRDLLRMIKSVDRWSTRISELSLQGDQAIATVNGVASGVILDPKGKEHTAISSGVARDTWRKLRDGWKLQRHEDVKTELLLDGKMVDPYDPFGEQKAEGKADEERKDLPVEEGYVPFRGYKVWYRAIGGTSAKEPPLLVLHGGPGYPHDYLQPLEALTTRERKVIFYDQLGCGNSDHAHNPGLPHDPAFWSVDLFVQEVGAVRRALKLDRCSILGQSWGGMLAMQYALTHPRGLVSLVISSSPASMPQSVAEANRLREMLPKEVQETLLKHEKAGTTDSAEYQKAAEVFFKRYVCRLDPYPEYIARAYAKFEKDHEFYNVMNGPSEFFITGKLKDWDITPRLGEISVPTLVMGGRQDEATPAITRTVHQGIRQSEYLIFENGDHLMFAEEPEKYNRVVNDFLLRHKQ